MNDFKPNINLISIIQILASLCRKSNCYYLKISVLLIWIKFIFSITRAVCGDKTSFFLILRHIQVYSQEVKQRQQRASTKLFVEHTREVKLGKQEIHFIPSVNWRTNPFLSWQNIKSLYLKKTQPRNYKIWAHWAKSSVEVTRLCHHVLIFFAGKGSRGQGQSTGI